MRTRQGIHTQLNCPLWKAKPLVYLHHLFVVVMSVGVIHHLLFLLHVVLAVAIHVQLIMLLLLGLHCAYLGVLVLHDSIFVGVRLCWHLVVLLGCSILDLPWHLLHLHLAWSSLISCLIVGGLVIRMD